MTGPSDTAPSRSIRLHVAAPLAAEAEIALDRDAVHYLANVMRVVEGDSFLVFNSGDGEWLARVAAVGKRAATIRLDHRTRPPSPPPDVELWFAPIKKARTDFIVEKATELGARRIRPVLTRRTNAERVRLDRLTAHAVEAAEQCGLVYVPELLEPAPLARVLTALDGASSPRRLYFCDESGGAAPLDLMAEPGPAAILIGPEGGFDPEEAATIRAKSFARAVGLGPRILRADTAVVAALTLWQRAAGDWSSDPR